MPDRTTQVSKDEWLNARESGRRHQGIYDKVVSYNKRPADQVVETLQTYNRQRASQSWQELDSDGHVPQVTKWLPKRYLDYCYG